MSFVTKEYLRDLNLLEKDEIIVGIILTLSAGVITAVIYYFSFSGKKERSKLYFLCVDLKKEFFLKEKRNLKLKVEK
jgi:hypothetical protein